MQRFARASFRYTPFFCEENVWWLARALSDAQAAVSAARVLFLSNPWQQIVLLRQRAGRGGVVAWDYHVVLLATVDGAEVVFDFDSELPFPVPCSRYLVETFPPQHRVPGRYRTWVREIAADAYLASFHSDRSHMHGRLPPSAFPDYPPIGPPDGAPRITLADYRDMHKTLPDGSTVRPIDDLIARYALTP